MHGLRSITCTASVLAAVVVAAAPAFAAGSWHIETSANPSADDQLGTVLAVSPTDVWSIGSQYAANGGLHPLIERFDGATWRSVGFPEPAGVRYDVLSGLSATSAADVWTVGFSRFGYTNTFVRPLAEHYNGTAWSLVTLPSTLPDSALYGVAAVSPTNVWTVGAVAGSPMVVHYDGSAWSSVASPSITGAALNEVVAVSPTDLWAIGNQSASGTRAIAEHYDGTAWSQVALPAPGIPNSGWSLYGLSATAADDVWAVGSVTSADGLSTYPIAEHYNGTGWAVTQAPSLTSATPNSGFNAVTAVSPADVWAVGSGGPGGQQGATLIEHFDGTSWQVVPSPNRTADNGLEGVAQAGGLLWATGVSFPANSSNGQTLVETYP